MANFRYQPEIFLRRGKSTLVISVGDSWTFGDSLGTIEQDPWHDDYEARSTQSYGRLVADELDADWLNYGYCGGNNITVITLLSNLLLGHHYRFLTQHQYQQIRAKTWPETVQDLMAQEQDYDIIIQELRDQHCASTLPYTELIKQYQRVVILVTLTETGRDVTAHYSEPSVWEKFQTCEKYLEFEESYMYWQLTKLIDEAGVDYFVGRNFTVDLPSTTNSLVSEDSVWIKQNFLRNQQNGFHNHDLCLKDILISGPVSGAGLSPMTEAEKIDMSDRKRFFVQQVGRADNLWTWLRNNPLHHFRYTCHPKKDGHRLWADHILNKLS